MELLTISEVARRLKISRDRAPEWLRQRRIPLLRLSPRRIRVRETDLQAWLDQKRPH